MMVVPVANNTGREQPVYFRFMQVNRTVSEGKGRPAVLHFNTFQYIPSWCGEGEEADGLAGCDAPAHFYAALLDVHFYWLDTWKEQGRMELSLPSRPADTDGVLVTNQATHALVLDMITRSDTVWPRYGTSPGYDQPGVGSDGFQEIFTASMMAALEWGMFPYGARFFSTEIYTRGGSVFNFKECH
jgi:hypothetical protein